MLLTLRNSEKKIVNCLKVTTTTDFDECFYLFPNYRDLTVSGVIYYLSNRICNEALWTLTGVFIFSIPKYKIN